MTNKHPKTRALAGLCLASAFLWPALTHAGQIASEDFSDYPNGPLINAGTGTADINGGSGWAGPWELTNTNPWWTPAAIGSSTVDFMNADDDLIITGKGLTQGGGRHQRFMEAAVDSGTLWFSVVMEPLQEQVEQQFWVTGGTYDQPDDDPDMGPIVHKFNMVAGVRFNNAYFAYVDTSRGTTELPIQYDPEVPDAEKVEVGGAGEVYVRLQNEDESLLEYNQPVLAVGKITFAAEAQPTVEYFIFLSGDDTSDPANASYVIGPFTVAADRPALVDGLATFGVRADSRYNNIRFATTYREVVPTFNCLAVGPETRDPVSVTDDALDAVWLTNSFAYPVDKFFADGGNNVEAADEADYGANAHVMWDNDTVYVAVVVTDEEVRNGETDPDSIEIYFDGDMSRSFIEGGWPTVYDQVDDYQFIFNLSASAPEGATITGSWFDNPTGNPDGYKGLKGANTGQDFAGIEWQVIETASGYILEASFSMSQVLKIDSPMVDMAIGFDVAVADFDDTGEVDAENNPIIEKSHYFFCDEGNKNWQATANFGTLFLQPALVPIAEEMFDYTIGDSLVEKNGGTGFGGAWQTVWQPSWATGNPWDVVTGFDFSGDFDSDGNAMGAGGGGVRVGRMLAEARTSGVSFVSFTVDPATGSVQAWLTNAQDENADDIIDNTNVGLLGGIRISGNTHPVQIIAPTAENVETYVDLEGAYYASPFVVIIAVLHDAGQLAYHIFGPGNPVGSPDDADYIEVVDLPDGMAASFDAFIMARFNAQAKIGPIRVGDGFAQVAPAKAVDPKYPVPAYQVPTGQTIAVDGMLDLAWTGSSAEPVEKFWSDGGANVMAASPADFSATAHMLWEDGTLYIAVPVNDDEIRDGETDPDSVEIYLDGDDSNSVPLGWPTNYDQVDDFQLVFNLSSTASEGATITGSWFDNPTGNPAGYKGLKGANEGQTFDGIAWQVATSSTGYVLEVSIDTATVLGWSEGMMDSLGFDVAVVDHDDTGEVDAENNPIIAKSHYFMSDSTNSNWQATQEFGTAFLLAPAATYVDLTETTLSVDAAGTTDSVGVLANLQYVEWEAVRNQAWITIDSGTPGFGDGLVEFTVAENTGAASRSGRIDIFGKRLTITQAGTGNAAILAIFPNATYDATLGAPWYDTPWFGTISGVEADLPWYWHVDHGWQYLETTMSAPGSVFAFDLGVSSWLWVPEANYPWVYVYALNSWAYYLEGTFGPRWFYINASGEWTPIQ